MTELREGILRNQIQYLEGAANKLQEMVYFQLAGLPDDQEEMDSRLLRNLLDMDRLQTEIDELTDKLKAEGFWKPASYEEGKYIYIRPKVKPKPKPKKQPRKPRKQYPVESPTPAKLKAQQAAEKAARAAERAAVAAEKQRLKDERRAEREAVRKAPKAPRQPRQRKPAESKEIVLLKRRRLNARTRMNALNRKYEPDRQKLEERVRYFEAKLIELAEVNWKDRGHQKRNTARGHLQNAQKQLEELPATFDAKRKKFEDQLTKIDLEIAEQYRKEAS